MERRATVDRLLDGGRAELLAVRESACSGDCHHCAGCGAVSQTLRLIAHNPIGAQRGDVVLVASQAAPVLWGAALLYLLPLLAFFAGYLGAMPLGVLPIALGGGAFFLGLVPALLYNRRLKRRPPVYTITDFVK